MKKYYLLLITLFFSCLGFAHTGKDSVLVKKDPGVKKIHFQSNNVSGLDSLTRELLKEINRPNIINTSEIGGQYRSFPSLNEYENEVAPYSFLDNLAEFTKDYLETVLKTDNRTDSIIKAGEELLDIIEDNKKFIDVMSGDELLEFPVGMKKRVSPASVLTIGVLRAKLHRDYAEVDLFAELTLAEVGDKKLFFGAQGVKISHQGGIYGEAKLSLLANAAIGQSGGQWLLTFKGDFDEATGTTKSESYVIIDCEGKVKKIALEGDVRIAKTVAVPVDEEGNKTHPNATTPKDGQNPVGNESYVGASFKLEVESLDDLLIQVDIPGFEPRSLPGWVLKGHNMVLDLSDTKNSPQVEFPDIYREKNLIVQGNENLWRGFYAKEVSVTLPAEFRKKGSDKRITAGAKGLIIDNFGVSGHFFVNNILHLNEGDASKWQFSVDSLHADIQVNHFIEAGFSGKIVLPISESDSSGNGALSYKGLITADKIYSVRVDVDEDVDFNIFKSRAKLFKESFVELKIDNGKFRPEANLTGLMAFNKQQKAQQETLSSSSGESIEELEFEGLSFQEFHIQTAQRPYLNIKYAGFKDTIALPKMGGFQLGFYDIEIKTDDNVEAELGFNGFINLDESGIRGDVRLRIIGELKDGEYLKWRYKTTKVDSIEIDIKRKSFEFYGKLHFFEDNPMYGKGLAGQLRLESESLGIEMGARGIFGNTGEYRYWFVDAHGRPTKSDNENFKIYDLGGGVYHHMRKAGVDERANSMSGIYYAPDNRVKFGFKALAAFEVKKAFTGLIAIEMSFNKSGGVNRLGFYGAAALMKGNSSGAGNPMGEVDEMQAKVAEKEQSLSNFHELSIDKEGITYFATEVFPDLLTGKEQFAAQVGIDFDFTNKTYWGMFDVFLNVGVIKGAGEKNRLGYIEFYNAPTDWYIYVGTPTKRFGVKDIPIGPYKAMINLYYMSGTILPDPALPPANVIDILNLKGDELLFGRNFSNELAMGNGYAFGAQFQLGMGFDWGVIYASIEAGVGFDLMMRNFGDAHCKGKEGPIGMDGWYATGQLYAYLQGEIGAQIKVFGIKKRVRILQAGIAVLAQGQLPNPVFIKGYAGVRVRVLGIVTIRARLKVIIGEECEIIGKSGMQNVVVISDIMPSDGANEVDVFDAVQVAFNVPMNSELKVEEDRGTKTYRVSLKEMTVKEGNNVIVGDFTWNNTNDLLIFESDDILPPETKITAVVKVSFEEKISGSWKPVIDNGQHVVEEKISNFTTGKAPTKIPYKNIVYMYPVIDQQYMLPKESNTGYIQLEKGQDYLFGLPGYEDKLYYIDENGNYTPANFSYNNADNKLSFSIPNLNNQQKYTFQLITAKSGSLGEGTSVQEIFTDVSEDVSISGNMITGNSSNDALFVRLGFNFNTSRHNTFVQKMKSLKIRNQYTLIDGSSDVGALGIGLEEYEPFGENDVKGTKYTAHQPFLHLEAVFDDSYYKDEIYPLIYKEYPLDKDIYVDRNTEELGMPPKRSFKITTGYDVYVRSNPTSNHLKTQFPHRWHQALAYKRDFVDLQYKIVNRHLNVNQVQPWVFYK